MCRGRVGINVCLFKRLLKGKFRVILLKVLFYFVVFVAVSETRPCYVIHAGLELTIFATHLSKSRISTLCRYGQPTVKRIKRPFLYLNSKCEMLY